MGGNTDAAKLNRARHYGSLLQYINEWYNNKMESVLKTYTEVVNKSK